MFERKVDYDQLDILLGMKMKPAEIARKMGVHRSSISKAIKKIRGQAHKIVALEKAKRYSDYRFTFVGQLQDDVGILRDLLDPVIRYLQGDKDAFISMQRRIESKSVEQGEPSTEKGSGKKRGNPPQGGGKKSKIEQKVETFDFTAEPRLIAVSIIREIREHLQLQLNAINTLASGENVRAFQKHLLDIMGEMAPDAREKLIARLRSEHAIRADLILD